MERVFVNRPVGRFCDQTHLLSISQLPGQVVFSLLEVLLQQLLFSLKQRDANFLSLLGHFKRFKL